MRHRGKQLRRDEQLVKYISSEKCVKMLHALCALKMAEKFNVQQWTLHTMNERHFGDVAEATSQISLNFFIKFRH